MKTVLSKLHIIVFISLISVFAVFDSYGSTKSGYAIFRIELFTNAIHRFHNDVGRYPNGVEGLKILIEKPNDDINWKGPYLPYPMIPTDPWNNAFIYIFPAKYGHKPYDLYSCGPNGVDDLGGKDDYANWKIMK